MSAIQKIQHLYQRTHTLRAKAQNDLHYVHFLKNKAKYLHQEAQDLRTRAYKLQRKVDNLHKRADAQNNNKADNLRELAYATQNRANALHKQADQKQKLSNSERIESQFQEQQVYRKTN